MLRASLFAAFGLLAFLRPPASLADAKTLLPRQCSAGNSLPFAGDGFGAAFSLSLRSTHRWVSQLMFFEMRHAAAPAFKRTYIGQFAETLRPSNKSHVPSAAWAQRQLRLRAFSVHDEARFSAIHARLHWLPLLVEHSLAVAEVREHTTQTCAKRRPVAHSTTSNKWPPVSCPHTATTSIESAYEPAWEECAGTPHMV